MSTCTLYLYFHPDVTTSVYFELNAENQCDAWHVTSRLVYVTEEGTAPEETPAAEGRHLLNYSNVYLHVHLCISELFVNRWRLV